MHHAQIGPLPEPYYPESDGAPMGETGVHGLTIWDTIHQLALRFRADPHVYVGGNQFMYWEKGDPTQVVCPDVYVAFGPSKVPPRDTWKTWVEGKFPDFIMEITSKKTKVIDQGSKRGLYEALDVKEYVLFDPFGEWLNPRLQQWIAVDGTLVKQPAANRYRSTLLGVDIEVDAQRVQLILPDGRRLPHVDELTDSVDALTEAVEAAEERAETAEAELARLRDELRRLRGG